MPANDREVWDYFGSVGDDNQQVNFLAFSSFAFDKFEWMDKFKENNGRPPSEAETNNWISELPNSRLDEMREWAENFFDTAARAFLEEEHRQEVESAVNSAIVSSVKDSNESMRLAVTASNEAVARLVQGATAFRNTWLPNLFLGIISSFIFAVIILIAAVIFTRDPSPIALLKSLASGSH